MWAPIATGIETEYGIMIRGRENDDPFLASRLLLEAYQENEVGGPIASYGLSYPMQTSYPQADESLVILINEVESSSVAPTADETDSYLQTQYTTSSKQQTKEKIQYKIHDMMLANGARFYIDHAHPEYSTPECLSPRLLVAADKAGEYILARCLYWVNAHQKLAPEEQIVVYKNNSDWKSNSYGCHENYLLSRRLYDDLLQYKSHQIYRYLLPFLITRTLVSGSGKVGSENGTPPVGFQLAQRADFFETLMGLQTTFRRPLFNTRDEPHASQDHFRRLHVILGDANMAEYSTYLKIGTTQLVLGMLEAGFIRLDLTLHDPLSAFRSIARDLSFAQPLLLENGQKMTALEIQYQYLEQAQKYLEQSDSNEEQWGIWRAWKQVLDTLPKQWKKLTSQLDWAIKKYLLDRYLSSQGASWEEVMLWQPVIEAFEGQGQDYAQTLAKQARLAWNDLDKQRAFYFGLRRISLEYHDIRQDSTQGEIGLFYQLQQRGAFKRILTDTTINSLIREPPHDTRAWIRGKCIDRFADDLIGANWDRLYFSLHPSHQQDHMLDLANPYMGTKKELSAMWHAMDSATRLIEYFT